MDFSFSKFQKFVLIFYLFALTKASCSAKLYDFSIISGLIVFGIQVSLGEGTVISKSNASTPFTIISEDGRDSSNPAVVRDPRILKDLSKLNRQGCLAKMLCGIEVAVPPSDKYQTTTLNDYAYLVKTFFDTFSFSGLTGTLSGFDDIDDSPPKSTRGDKPSKRKKPSGSDLYKEQSIKDRLENEGIKKMYEDLTLEELLGDDGSFRKRTGPAAATVPISSAQGQQTISKIRNPRYDKTMYLDRKQREFSMATDEAQKLTIAREVGNKFRRGRQCRALFNTGFSFCPWQPKDLQDLLMNRTTYTSSITTTQRSYTLADSPNLYDSYTHLLNYQDDEYPNAFVNPSTILVETDARETQINDSEGKGFLTYDPSSDSNVLSYVARPKNTSKKSRKKKKIKETIRESSSEEAKDIDSSENSKIQSSNEEENEEGSVEYEEALTHDDEINSDEDADSVESQDDEEDDHKTWSDSDSKESPTEKPKRKKTKPISQKGQKPNTKYSVMKEALKFTQPNIDKEYMTVAQNFAKPNDRIISMERYRGGLPSVWDPNKEKWNYPQITQVKKQYEPARKNKNDDDKSKESESSEEEEEEYEEEEDDDAKVAEEENHRFKERERRVPPPRPLIRFRLPKFRGRRSIDYYTTSGNERYLKRRPLPPELLIL